MKSKRIWLVLVIGVFILTSCSQDSEHSVKAMLSPFEQYEKLKFEEENNDDQVDDILRTYGIYDKILENIPKEEYINTKLSNISIDGFRIGNKQCAMLLINKGHLYIYVMFSTIDNKKWLVDGFTYQMEREKPEYRIERSSNNENYYLVIKHEANHGTGLRIFNEIWYKSDGLVVAEYPIEESTLFFPELIEPTAMANFCTTANYNGESTIYLSYRINIEYSYKETSKNQGLSEFRSKYLPVIYENWEYDLKTQELIYVSSEPEFFGEYNTIKHRVSDEYGIIQGYIDFYRSKLGNNKITSLAEWENFIEIK